MCSQNGLLFSLPCEITLSVLLDWVDLKDLAAVDNAFCERKQRHHLLAIFSSPLFIMSSMDETEHTPTCHSGFWDWVCKRSIRVSSLVLLGEVKPFVTNYLRQVGLHVKSLRLKGTDFVTSSNSSIRFAEALSYCFNLTTLTLHSTRVNDAVLGAISQCSSLKVFRRRVANSNARESDVTSGPSAQATKLHLTTLDLQGDTYGFQDFLNMTEFTTLCELHVKMTEGDYVDAVATKLQLCTSNLVTLSVWGGKNLTDSQVTTLLGACPSSVQHFTLQGITMTEACAPCLARALPRLKSIKLNRVPYYNALLLLLAEMRSETLEEVDLHVLGGEIAQGLAEALTHCPNFRILRVADIDRYPFDYSVLCNITALVVSCRGSGVVFLERLSPHCKKLQFLGLKCPDLRFQDLTMLSENFPALRQFDFFNVNTNENNPGDLLCEDSQELRALPMTTHKVRVCWNDELTSVGWSGVQSLFCK